MDRWALNGLWLGLPHSGEGTRLQRPPGLPVRHCGNVVLPRTGVAVGAFRGPS